MENDENLLFCAIVDPEGLHDMTYYDANPALFNPFRVAQAIKKERHDRYFLTERGKGKQRKTMTGEFTKVEAHARNSEVHEEAWIDLKVWKDLRDYTDYFINIVRPRTWARYAS